MRFSFEQTHDRDSLNTQNAYIVLTGVFSEAISLGETWAVIRVGNCLECLHWRHSSVLSSSQKMKLWFCDQGLLVCLFLSQQPINLCFYL